MRLSRVRVQNYKPILDSGWVDIEGNITTLLGGNESGKTSFLEAINSFSNRDECNDTDICDMADYEDKSELPIIKLEFELEQEEIEEYQDDGGELHSKSFRVTKFADGSREIDTRKIATKEYELQDLTEPSKDLFNEILEKLEAKASENNADRNFQNFVRQEFQEKVEEIIGREFEDEDEFYDAHSDIFKKIKEMPESTDEIEQLKENCKDRILSDEQRCLSNFTEFGRISTYSVPSIVYHSEIDTISDKVHEESLENDGHKTFRNLLDIVGISYEEFKEKKDVEQTRVMDRAGVEIEGEINKLWEQKEVAVTIQYRNKHFLALIKDEQINSDEEVTRSLRQPSERSKGFQWFFSFYINLTAESGESEDNTIILLDDPAVFLHPQGKRDWLNAIEKLSYKCQIVYSTHSPYLIRKEFPNRIRLTRDTSRNGTKITDNLLEGNDTTLEPLREALGIGLGDSPFVSKRKILVEGSSDYYIFIGLANYFKEYIGEDILDWSEVTIMPTNGGNQMVQAARWVSSEEFSYALVLDNDDKGKEVEGEIQEHHHEIDDDRIVLLRKEEGPNFHTEIEDMFAPEFYIDCVNSAYSGQFDDFTPLEIEKIEGDIWEIEDVEYNGRKIVSKVNDIFEQRGQGEVDKVMVANEIRDRLTSGRDVSESDVTAFRRILGKLREIT